MIEVGRSQWPRGPRRSYRRFERTRRLHLRRHAVQQTAVQHTCVAGQQMAAVRQQLQLRHEACNLDTEWQTVHRICVVMVQDGSINISWIIIYFGGSSVPCRYSLGIPVEAVGFLRVNKNPQHVGGHGCLLWLLCVVRYRSLRRTDHSFIGVLPTVVRRCVWSRNLVKMRSHSQSVVIELNRRRITGCISCKPLIVT